jgi:hypothetical protein
MFVTDKHLHPSVQDDVTQHNNTQKKIIAVYTAQTLQLSQYNEAHSE